MPARRRPLPNAPPNRDPQVWFSPLPLMSTTNAALALTAQRAHELARTRWDIAEKRAHLLEPGAKLHVAHLHRQHRILKRRQQRVGVASRLDAVVDEAPRASRGRTRRGGLECGARQAVALGKCRVCTPRSAVGQLHRPEQLLLENIPAAFIQ